MKARLIKFNETERKAVEPFVDNARAGQIMMNQGAKLHETSSKKLWEAISGLYPREMHDACFNYDNFELSYLEATNKAEKYRFLKEKAIREQNFELAATYRDQEKKENDK